MEEIIILTGATIMTIIFVYRIKNLFKGHNPEFEKQEDLKPN